MAIKELEIVELRREYIGLSSDTKPTTDVPIGSTLYCTDTTTFYIWDGSAWQPM